MADKNNGRGRGRWVCRELLKEVANTAEAAADLEEWKESRPMRTRSAKGEITV